MEPEDIDDVPMTARVMGLPHYTDLRFMHKIYKPSAGLRKKLQSEAGRQIFCEEFIEDIHLGPLSDLCARTLAQEFPISGPIPFVHDDPVKRCLYFEMLSVDTPLEAAYRISDERYWHRVVLAKSKTHGLVKSANWKNIGISLKLVDLLEAEPVEYFTEEDIRPLAEKIKEYVTDLHLSKLRSLQEKAFAENYKSSSESSSSGSYTESDIESEFNMPIDHIYEEDDDHPRDVTATEEPDGLETNSQMAFDQEEEQGSEEERESELDRMDEEIQHAQEALERRLKAAADQLYKEKMERHKLRRRQRRALAAVPPPKKKRNIKSVFDIPVPESEDEEQFVDDRRNPERFLKWKKKYKYPPEDCHHINFRFLRLFEYLVSFTLEFQAPKLDGDYHTKYFNFSYRDMENLAFGLSFLNGLKTFRLINSRMDARKLDILVTSLQTLESLETVDFSYDQLQDDCCYGLYRLLRGTTSIKSLELGGNYLQRDALSKLAIALTYYNGNIEYLGLAYNPLSEEGIHQLVNAIIKAEQVSNLSLKAAQLTDKMMICCIANELLCHHKPLRQLDVSGVVMGKEAGLEFMKALTLNQTVLQVDCRGCEFDLDIESDIEVVLRRNRYILENPYLGDPTKTAEEINAFVERLKNPILLRVFETIERRARCLENVPDELVRFSVPRISEILPGSNESLVRPKRSSARKPTIKYSYNSYYDYGSSSDSNVGPFVYDTDNLDEKEFLEKVYTPGPSDRFKFFYKKKLRYNSDLHD